MWKALNYWIDTERQKLFHPHAGYS